MIGKPGGDGGPRCCFLRFKAARRRHVRKTTDRNQIVAIFFLLFVIAMSQVFLVMMMKEACAFYKSISDICVHLIGLFSTIFVSFSNFFSFMLRNRLVEEDNKYG